MGRYYSIRVPARTSARRYVRYGKRSATPSLLMIAFIINPVSGRRGRAATEGARRAAMARSALERHRLDGTVALTERSQHARELSEKFLRRRRRSRHRVGRRRHDQRNRRTTHRHDGLARHRSRRIRGRHREQPWTSARHRTRAGSCRVRFRATDGRRLPGLAPLSEHRRDRIRCGGGPRFQCPQETRRPWAISPAVCRWRLPTSACRITWSWMARCFPANDSWSSSPTAANMATDVDHRARRQSPRRPARRPGRCLRRAASAVLARPARPHPAAKSGRGVIPNARPHRGDLGRFTRLSRRWGSLRDERQDAR